MSALIKKKRYSNEDVEKALNEIKNKLLTVHGASKKYKIPLTTWRHRMDGLKSDKMCSNYTEESVAAALSHIKNKEMTVYAAAKNYNIPASTLRNRINGRHNKIHGSEKALGDEVESQLAEWIVLCARAVYPKTKNQIRKTAAEIAKLSSTKPFIKKMPTS